MDIVRLRPELMTEDARMRLKQKRRPLHEKKPCNGNHTYDYYHHKDLPYRYLRASIVRDEEQPLFRRYVFEECENIEGQEEDWIEVDKQGTRYLYAMHSTWRKIADGDLFKVSITVNE